MCFDWVSTARRRHVAGGSCRPARPTVALVAGALEYRQLRSAPIDKLPLSALQVEVEKLCLSEQFGRPQLGHVSSQRAAG